MYIALLVLIIILILCLSWSKEEKFGTVLGSAGPYQKSYNHCLNECNRSDPGLRFLEQGNIGCSAYCDYTLSQSIKNKVPPKLTESEDNMEKCERICGNDRYCLSKCYGYREVEDWCDRLWCPYSPYNKKFCMDQCISVWNTLNNQSSWKWDMEK